MTSRTLLLTLPLLVGLVAVSSCEQGPQDKTDMSAVETAPRLRLRLSGSLEGYLTPCGCSSGMKGGLARRVFRNNLDKHNVDLLLEGGRLIKHAGELEWSKLYATLQVLEMADYKAVGLAAVDLTLNKDESGPLLGALAPVVASDLLTADGKPWSVDEQVIAPAFREVRLAHVNVRIGSLTMSLPEGAAGKAFKLLSPEQGWQRAMAGVAPDTYRVLMVHADGAAIKKLRFEPKPDLLIAVGLDFVEPPIAADNVDGVPLVYAGTHGRVLLDVTVVRGKSGPMVTRYQLVPLEESLHQNQNAKSAIDGHRLSVKDMGLREKLANQRPIPDGLKYVGLKACLECHEQEEDECKDHAHGHAWKTLIETGKKERWPATHYPECVSCHVVGYGEKSGFISPEKTPDLSNVTCESCHGPGSAHAADETKKMPYSKPEPKVCMRCHNSEHSPGFDYEPYWKKIEHGQPEK